MQRTHVVKSSDLTSEEGADIVTRTISLDGRTVEIDLTKDQDNELEDTLAVYFEKGRKVGRQRPARATGDRSNAKAIRQWAEREGVAVPARGRIPGSVRAAYEAAQA